MDFALLSTAILLLVSLSAFLFYYSRLRRLAEEHERAKNLVSDIVLSFNAQAERQEEKLDAVIQKSMIFSSRGNRVESRVDAQEKELSQITIKLSELSDLKQTVKSHLTIMDQKITEITESHEELIGKLVNLEEKAQRPLISEASMEAVVPIKQEGALAPLTPTELAVLEMLATEGEKTAPGIKVKIGLTREHTARLMKKLYEAGYLERTTGKIPFAYRIKEEMRKFLKKSEVRA